MKLRNTLFFLLLVSAFSANGQQVDSDSLIKRIYSTAIEFYISQGIIDKKDVNDSSNIVFVVEVKDGKLVGYNINGIYSIGTFNARAKRHILIKEGSKFKIYDLKEIDIALKAVIDFWFFHHLDTDALLVYINKITAIYKSNYKVP